MAVSPRSVATTSPTSSTRATRSVLTVKMPVRDTSRSEPSLYFATSWNCCRARGMATTFSG